MLSLSSGGARGFAHIGVIEHLLDCGYEIVGITGCSMGALVGGVYASGGLDLFKEWAISLQRSDVFKLYDLTFSVQGLIKGERVFKEIEKIVPENNIENLHVPFKAVATDIRTEELVIFESGSLYNALRASTSIPGVIKPVIIDDRELLDGGILNPLPMDLTQEWEYDLLVAVDVNAQMKEYMNPWCIKPESKDNDFMKKWDEMIGKWFNIDKKSDEVPAKKNNNQPKKLGFFDLMVKANDLMQDQVTKNMVEFYKPEVLVEIPRKSCSTFEFYKAQKLIDIGKEACQLALDNQSYHRKAV